MDGFDAPADAPAPKSAEEYRKKYGIVPKQYQQARYFSLNFHTHFLVVQTYSNNGSGLCRDYRKLYVERCVFFILSIVL